MNPYIDTSDANTYFGERFDSGAWDTASESDKLKALKTGTRAIDRLNFLGVKTDESQELQFPRDDDTVVPDDIKWACCEIAYALLDGIEPELEFENLDMSSQGYGSVRSTYNRDDKPIHMICGIVSSVAWRYLLPYLRDGRAIDVTRV
jgi:hypothetical protein